MTRSTVTILILLVIITVLHPSYCKVIERKNKKDKCVDKTPSLNDNTVARLRAMWEERWFDDAPKFPHFQLTAAQQLWWNSLAYYAVPGRITSAGGNVDQTDFGIAAELQAWKLDWFDPNKNIPEAQQTPKQKKENKDDSGKTNRKKRNAEAPPKKTTTKPPPKKRTTKPPKKTTTTDEGLAELLNASRLFGESWLSSDSDKFPKINLTDAQKNYLQGIIIKKKKSEKGKNLAKKRDCETIVLPAYTRMEWRRMADVMRKNFVAALKKLTTFYPDPQQIISAYDIFVKMHRMNNSPGAQRGASLLPWHRELLWRFSNALRLQGYTAELPYWDCVLDSGLPDPSNSVLWTTLHLGTNKGEVKEPFCFIQPVTECGKKLTRKLLKGKQAAKLLFTREKVSRVLSKACYSHLTWGYDKDFESYYNDVHASFGPMQAAQMADPNCAPTDPAFWLHISYIDLIWERYRMYEQDRNSREWEYPRRNTGKIPSAMGWFSDMRPFGTNPNIHGLSDLYTGYYYSYEERPSQKTCKSNKDCDRGFGLLWCDTKKKKCHSKIQEGGTCKKDWPNTQCWCPNSKKKPNCAKDCKCKCLRT